MTEQWYTIHVTSTDTNTPMCYTDFILYVHTKNDSVDIVYKDGVNTNLWKGAFGSNNISDDKSVQWDFAFEDLTIPYTYVQIYFTGITNPSSPPVIYNLLIFYANGHNPSTSPNPKPGDLVFSNASGVSFDVIKGILDEICIASGALVHTDQGEIPIEKLDHKENTINGKKIVCVTKTLNKRGKVVLFEKGALGKNIPSQDTMMTYGHMLLYKRKMVSAHSLIKKCKKVLTVDYGKYVHNVILEEYSRMKVNNMVCATLRPDNLMGQLYMMANKIE